MATAGEAVGDEMPALVELYALWNVPAARRIVGAPLSASLPLVATGPIDVATVDDAWRTKASMLGARGMSVHPTGSSWRMVPALAVPRIATPTVDTGRAGSAGRTSTPCRPRCVGVVLLEKLR
jgi:hypothetical protein